MSHPDLCAVVLAAGKGTRMASDVAKVLHRLGGRELIAHVLDACLALEVHRTIVVVGYQGELVERVVQPWGVQCVLQDRQLGTGHALRCAETAVDTPLVLVLCGDCPLVEPALLERLLESHRERQAACTVIAARMSDPGRYGRMIVDHGGRLQRIVEFKDANAEERRVDLVNSGIYAFAADRLFPALQSLRADNAQGEYYLTDVVAMLVAAGDTVGTLVSDDPSAVLGVNTPQELAEAERVLRRRVRS